jgi:uncharacterized membrane protein YqhA
MTEPELHGASERLADREQHLFARLASWTRFVIFVPVLGLFIGAVVLTGAAGIDTARTVMSVLEPGSDLKHLVVQFIELADIYLLAIVLYIMSLGLYELFVDEHVPMPHWLRFRGLDDLKEKLVGVVVVVMSVLFLGKVIEGSGGIELLWLGLSIASVTIALGYYVSHAMDTHK